MRLVYIVLATGLVLLSGLALWYQVTARTCPAPLYYRLGKIDTGFNVSPDEAKKYAKKAEERWEKATGRNLFIYDERADLTINYIYDDRQKLTDEERREREKLDKEWQKNETTKKQIEQLRIEYEDLSKLYQTKADAYEERLRKYNKEVNKYNDQGGAPADIYERLEEERQSLAAESTSLQKTADKLNALASKINKLSAAGNELVNRYNREVSNYNEKFGFVREFTQGDYKAKENKIDIYKFSSEAEVVTVLTHEFGHALGLNHVADENGVMYYLLRENMVEPVPLSAADLAEFNNVCGPEAGWSQKLRGFIKSLLIKL